MRKLFHIFLIAFLTISVFSPIFAQSDFNFEFYPPSNYYVFEGKDTTKLFLNSVVEKNGNQLKVHSTDDLTNARFEAEVSFLGHAVGQDLLLYATQEGHYIYCNPMWGYLLILHMDETPFGEVYGQSIIDYKFLMSQSKLRMRQ